MVRLVDHGTHLFSGMGSLGAMESKGSQTRYFRYGFTFCYNILFSVVSCLYLYIVVTLFPHVPLAIKNHGIFNNHIFEGFVDWRDHRNHSKFYRSVGISQNCSWKATPSYIFDKTALIIKQLYETKLNPHTLMSPLRSLHMIPISIYAFV